jgi:DNA-binding transcriptional LysR family regulator
MGLPETICSYTETMNDLNELQIFVLVAREMNFTRAAQALGVSKAAASRAIASLENRLGTRLFERTTRRLILTEAGETYFIHSQRALEESEDGEAAVSKLTNQPRGTLRVVMPVTLAQSSVGPRLAQFLQNYPELRLEITLKGGQIDPIAQRVDVVFQTARLENDSQIIQKRILSVQLGIYASPHYLARTAPLRVPRDLAENSCITLTAEREGTKWNLQKDGEVQEIRLRGRVAIGDPTVHRRLCLDGAGIAILPNWLIKDEVNEKTLVRVLPDWTPAPIELYVLYPTRLSMTPKLHAFMTFMETVLPC